MSISSEHYLFHHFEERNSSNYPVRLFKIYKEVVYYQRFKNRRRYDKKDCKHFQKLLAKQLKKMGSEFWNNLYKNLHYGSLKSEIDIDIEFHNYRVQDIIERYIKPFACVIRVIEHYKKHPVSKENYNPLERIRRQIHEQMRQCYRTIEKCAIYIDHLLLTKYHIDYYRLQEISKVNILCYNEKERIKYLSSDKFCGNANLVKVYLRELHEPPTDKPIQQNNLIRDNKISYPNYANPPTETPQNPKPLINLPTKLAKVVERAIKKGLAAIDDSGKYVWKGSIRLLSYFGIFFTQLGELSPFVRNNVEANNWCVLETIFGIPKHKLNNACKDMRLIEQLPKKYELVNAVFDIDPADAERRFFLY